MTKLANATAGRGRSLLAALLLVLGASALNTPLARAAEANHRTVSVTINKGETYTIEGVSEKASSPGIKVTNNPNALVVRTDAPGKIILVGADAGTWNLEVTLANGEKVTYAVNVKSEAPPQGSLVPGTAPTVMP
jgi:hypothetical protein